MWTGPWSGAPSRACEEGPIVRLSDLIRSPDPEEERPAAGTPARAPAAPSRAPADNGKGELFPGGAAAAPVLPRATSARGGTSTGGGSGGSPATELFRALDAELTAFLEAARENRPLSLERLEPLALRLVDGLADGDELVLDALAGRSGHGSLTAHCIRVAVFAVRIAGAMDYPREEQGKVALAALVHDVGMARFPPDFVAVERELTAREREEMQRHPEEGHKMLGGLGPGYRWLADVAHQEHERDDGSGYPRGLSGDQIGEMARIIALADIYEAMTHPRPHRKALAPFEAVREILTSARRRFTERALKGLIQGLSAFPVGSLVRLNTREVARVVTGNPGFPLRPGVEVLFNAAGERVQGRRIDLAKNSLQYIVDSVTVHESL